MTEALFSLASFLLFSAALETTSSTVKWITGRFEFVLVFQHERIIKKQYLMSGHKGTAAVT